MVYSSYCTIFWIQARFIRVNCNGMKSKRNELCHNTSLREGLLPSVSWHRGMDQCPLRGAWNWAPLSLCTMVRVKGFCSSLCSSSRCIYGNRIWSAFVSVLGQDHGSNVDWVGGLPLASPGSNKHSSDNNWFICHLKRDSVLRRVCVCVCIIRTLAFQCLLTNQWD